MSAPAEVEPEAVGTGPSEDAAVSSPNSNGGGDSDGQNGEPEADAMQFAHNMVSEGVRSRSILQAAHINIGRLDAGDRDEQLQITADLTSAADAAERSFVEPDHFADLVDVLRSRALVIVAGSPGAGRRTATLQALRRSGCERVVQIGVDDHLRHVPALVRRGGRKVGYVVDGLEASLIRRIREVELNQMYECVDPGECAIALVVDSAQLALLPRLDDVAVVELNAPNALDLLARRLEVDGRGPDVGALSAVVERLPPPVAPARDRSRRVGFLVR